MKTKAPNIWLQTNQAYIDLASPYQPIVHRNSKEIKTQAPNNWLHTNQAYENLRKSKRMLPTFGFIPTKRMNIWLHPDNQSYIQTLRKSKHSFSL